MGHLSSLGSTSASFLEASAGGEVLTHQQATATARGNSLPCAPCSHEEPIQHRQLTVGRAFGPSFDVFGTSNHCRTRQSPFQGTRKMARNTSEVYVKPAPSSRAGDTGAGLAMSPIESAHCEKPSLHWQLLPRHGCTVKEMVCVDQVP